MDKLPPIYHDLADQSNQIEDDQFCSDDFRDGFINEYSSKGG